MYQFIEFTDHSHQSKNLFSEQQLKPLRLFFKCIQLAEDSYQGVKASALANVQNQWRQAQKQDSSQIPNFRAYRDVVTESSQLNHESLMAEQHQLRKVFVRELCFEPNPLLITLERLSQENPAHLNLVRRIRHLSQDKSVYFESFSTSSLIKLSELCSEIPLLLEHINELKSQLKRAYKRQYAKHYQAGTAYLNHLKETLSSFKESLAENLLDRLGAANTKKDIHYSDNLYELVQEANALLGEENLSIEFPSRARRDLSKDAFIKAQNFIYSEGTAAQRLRLNTYSWHTNTSNYKAIYGNTSCLSVAPNNLADFIPRTFNWLYYLFSSVYRFRYNFIKNYAYLIAQQKLLSESRRQEARPPFNVAKDEDLIKLNELESNLQHAEQSFRAELLKETRKYSPNRLKAALIRAYLDNLQQSKLLINAKKIEILAEHSERLRTYVDMPELNRYSSLNIRALYNSKELKTSLLELYQQSYNSLNTINTREARGLLNKLNSIKIILDQFYTPDLMTQAQANTVYSITEMVDFSRTDFNSIIEVDLTKLRLQLSHYQESYKIQSLSHDPLDRRAAEQSLYTLIYNYLDFNKKHATETEFPHEKIEAIENCLLAINPISASFISEIAELRKNPKISCRKAKIEFHCRIAMNAIEPQIRRRSLSEAPQPSINLEYQDLPLNPSCSATHTSSLSYSL